MATLNPLPPINLDFGGLTVPRPEDVSNPAYDRLRGDGTIPPGTPRQVLPVIDDGGDPALSPPPPVFSEQDAEGLRQSPDPADPLALRKPIAPLPAEPETGNPRARWAASVRREQPAGVSPEQRKRDSSRFDPTLLDRFLPSGFGRLNPQEQVAEQEERARLADQAGLVNRLLKEQDKALRGDGAGANIYDGSKFTGTDIPVTTMGDRNASDLKASAEGPKPALKPWRDIAEVGLQAFLTGMVSIPRGIALAADAPRHAGAYFRGNPNLDQNAVAQALEDVTNRIRQAVPGDPARTSEFASQLSSGAGSMLSFLVGGAAARAVGLSVRTGTALTGAAVGGTGGYDDAKAYDATVAARYLSFLINAGLGLTEAIPIDRAFARFNMGTKGQAGQILTAMAANSFEEMVQEVGQQIGGNLTARLLYDNAREIFAGVTDAATVAAVIGGVFGGSVQTVRAIQLKLAQEPQKQAASGQEATRPQDTGQPAEGQQAASAASQPGTLNASAGYLAGTVVEVLGESPNGAGYTVRLPDGQEVFTEKSTVDIATDNASAEGYKGGNDQSSIQTPAPAGPVSRVAEQAARARDAFTGILARRDAQGRDGRIWSQRGRSEGDGAGLLVAYETSAEDAAALAEQGIPAPRVIEHEAATHADTFHKAISASKAATKFGASVYVYTPEEYARMRLFSTEDGAAGFAVKPDGDIVSVFASPTAPRGVGYSLLRLAVEQGGTKLDAFDTVLPTIYSALGFVETGRSPWNEDYKPPEWDYDTFKAFNNGRPDVVFMEYQPGGSDQANPDVSAIRAPEQMRGTYPAERQRPVSGIAEAAKLDDPSASKRDITDRFKEAVNLVVKQGRFGRGNSKAEAIYKWGQSVARVKSEGQMLELFHEGGHHLHSQLKPLLDAAIKRHETEIFRIADTLYGGGKLLDIKDKELRRREGFATFFQVYMNNPAEARVIAPGFLPSFESLMEENSPGIMGELQAIRREVDAWLTAKSSAQLARERVVSNEALGPIARIVESVKGGTLLHDIANLANQIYKSTLNDQHPLTLAARRLRIIAEENIRTQAERGLLNRKQVEAQLAKLDRRGRANPVKMAALARNAYNASSEMIATGIAKYGRDGAAVSKGIPEILAAVMGKRRLDPVIYQDFNTYLAMRRVVSEWKNYYATLAWDRAVQLGNTTAVEPPVKRFRRPDEVSQGDAQQAIADLEKANPQFARAAPDVYRYLDELLQYKVDAGILTQEAADAQRQIADYVPLRREMDKTGGLLGKSKDAATGKDNLIRVFKGSDRRILTPLESIMQMTHETVALVAKNDVKRALVDLALDVGQGSGAVIEQIPASTVKGTSVKLADVLKAAGDFSLADEIAQAMGRDEITMQEFLDEVLDGDEVGTIWRKADITEKGEPIVYVWRDGEMQAFQLNDAEWADDLYASLTELGKEQTNLAIQILGKPAAVLRAGVTTAPPFLIANIVRDQLSAWVLNDGVYPGVVLGKGLASDLFDRKTRRLYNLSMSSIGGSNVAALDKTRFGTEQTMLAKIGIGVTAESMATGFLRVVDSSETWSRQGIWRAAFDKAKADGLNVADAMIEAGYEASDYANYGRAGSKMLVARRLVTFLNANLQGLDKTLRTVGGGEGGLALLRKQVAPWVRRTITPAMAARMGLEGSQTTLPLTALEKRALARAGRTWSKMLMLAIPSALLAMLYWDDEEYEMFSPYLKGTRWMVKLGPGNWLAIPKPFQLASLATFVEYAIDSVLKGDPTAMQKFMQSQATVIAPPYENPGIKLAYELATNTNMFSGRDIVPSNVGARPNWLQYDEYTSEIGKLIGKYTGASPMVVDHAITGSFATWGRGLQSASNLLNPDRPTQGLDDFAFTQYFIKNGSRSTTIRPAFLDLVGQQQGKLVGAYSGYRELMEAGAEGQAAELLRNLSEDQRTFALLYQHQEADAKKLHPLRNAYDVVQTIASLRKEIVLNRVKEGGKDDGAPIRLSPTQQKLIGDRLSDLQVRLQRNALVVTGVPGFAQRKVLPTLPIIEQIKAINPVIATDLKIRLGTRVYTADIVARQWPAVKAEILRNGPKANLRPFVLKAKAAGTKIWTEGASQ